MRNLVMIFAAYMGTIICAYSTSVPSRELEDLVAEADHIVCGTVTNIVVLTLSGLELTNDTASTGPGAEGHNMRLDVTVDGDHYLYSTSTNRPTELHIMYGGIFNYELASQKRWLLNKRFIFLLKGSDYVPVYSVLFNREISDRDAIMDAIKQKEHTAQHVVAGCPSQAIESPAP